MSCRKDDHELFRLIREHLYTPVVGDLLDAINLTHQFLPQSVKPMLPEMVLVGRAMPVLHADVYGQQTKPFGLLTEALDQLQSGEIYVASGGNMRSAYWGELLTATARTRKAAGAVINGYHRDTRQVLEQNWPVFSRGGYAQDSAVRTIVTAFRISIEIEGTRIDPGDIIFGDRDGVVVIPARVEEQVIQQALEKARGEKKVRKAVENGMTATEAFRVFGIL